jgi:DNA-binding CsgD family transcriptional regulator
MAKRVLWLGGKDADAKGLAAFGFEVVRISSASALGPCAIIVVDLEKHSKAMAELSEANKPIVALGTYDQLRPHLGTVQYAVEKPSGGDVLGRTLQAIFAPPTYGHVIEEALESHGLTAREKEVARLALRGLPTRDIAEALDGVSDKTVKQHLGSIFRKFDATSRAELFASIFPF